MRSDMTPNLPLTVARDFWDRMADVCGGAYADSYLSGAFLRDGKLLPKTVTAWERLKDNAGAMHVVSSWPAALVKPPLFTR